MTFSLIDELAELIDEFPGKANHMQCFMHILNLVCKSILRQFDIPKAKQGDTLDEAAQALAMLAKELDVEEAAAKDADEEDLEDDEQGWIDEREPMSDDERAMLDESVKPIRLLLVKVCTALE